MTAGEPPELDDLRAVLGDELLDLAAKAAQRHQVSVHIIVTPFTDEELNEDDENSVQR